MAQAEITPPATVRLICDHAEPFLSNPGMKFFEPGCGDGNFLIEVLDRRLRKIPFRSASTFQNEVLLAIANLYGVDIRPVAISETRHRLRSQVIDFTSQRSQLDYRFIPLLEQILEKNFLTVDLLRDRSKIIFPLWQKKHDFEFTMTPTIFPVENVA